MPSEPWGPPKALTHPRAECRCRICKVADCPSSREHYTTLAMVKAMYADMKAQAKHHGYPCKNIEQYRHEAKLARHEAERRIKEAESHA